jgi:predicted pyridoxine 5'-phosphate oxidase superfamily flavin-nucleotide-binding protein
MSFYNDGSRKLQDQFDSRRLADRIESRLMREHLTEEDRAFVESLDMFFLATADDAGQPSCSYKGGDPGFVRAVSDNELAFPNYDGNGMFLSMGNVLKNARVGLLFMSFETPKRLRVHGSARVEIDDPLLESYHEAQFVVRVAVEKVFPNCPRYVHKYQRLERSNYVPRASSETPEPNWKKSEWAADVLPKRKPTPNE